MSATVDTIASQLSTLNTSDLSKIKQLTDMLMKGTIEVSQPITDDERIIFQALRAELSVAGVRSNISYDSLKNSRFYKQWCIGIETFSEFLENSFKNFTKSETQRLALSRILIQTIIQDHRRRNIPVSLGTIATNLHRVEQTFDKSFPGYLASGLAYLVPKALLRNSA